MEECRKYVGNSKQQLGPSSCQEEPQVTQCDEALKRLRMVTENLRTTSTQIGMRLRPLTGDLCMPPMAVKAPEKSLVPFAAELEDICDNLREIEHHINFILNHMEL